MRCPPSACRTPGHTRQYAYCLVSRVESKEVAVDTPQDAQFDLVSQRLGALPLVNHFLDRMDLSGLLARWLPAPDRRFRLDPAVAIRLVVVNLLIRRAPLYGLCEGAAPFASTELLVGVVSVFVVATSGFQTASTSVSVHGAYRGADATPHGGKPTPVITF